LQQSHRKGSSGISTWRSRFGSKEAEEIKDGDTIQGAPPIQMADLLNKADRSRQRLQRGARHRRQCRQSEIHQREIDSGQGTVGALVNDKPFIKKAAAGATEFRRTWRPEAQLLPARFFHKRGYEDSTALKSIEIAQLPGTMYDRRFVYDATKIFDKPDAQTEHEQDADDAGHFLEQGISGWQ